MRFIRMTRIVNLLAVLAVGGLLFAGIAAAQTATTTSSTTQQTTTATPPVPAGGTSNVGPGSQEAGHSWENHVNDREAHQQDRVANGVKQGQLSASQAAHLEKNQAKIQGQESRAEAAHNGRLTPNEKKNFQKEQNKQNNKIHNDRHPNDKQ
jgi:hypothetical protein